MCRANTPSRLVARGFRSGPTAGLNWISKMRRSTLRNNPTLDPAAPSIPPLPTPSTLATVRTFNFNHRTPTIPTQSRHPHHLPISLRLARPDQLLSRHLFHSRRLQPGHPYNASPLGTGKVSNGDMSLPKSTSEAEKYTFMTQDNDIGGQLIESASEDVIAKCDVLLV